MRLASFNVQMKGRRELFHIDGEVTLENMTDTHTYPEFSNLSATIEIDGNEKLYEPTGRNFVGHSFTVEDMITGFVESLIMDDQQYEKVFLIDKLQQLVDSYRAEMITLEGKPSAPRYILGCNMFTVYQLIFATDKFIYYNDGGDCYLMYDTEAHTVIAENYFAELGFDDSLENIGNGTEVCIYKAEDFY